MTLQESFQQLAYCLYKLEWLKRNGMSPEENKSECLTYQAFIETDFKNVEYMETILSEADFRFYKKWCMFLE